MKQDPPLYQDIKDSETNVVDDDYIVVESEDQQNIRDIKQMIEELLLLENTSGLSHVNCHLQFKQLEIIIQKSKPLSEMIMGYIKQLLFVYPVKITGILIVLLMRLR